MEDQIVISPEALLSFESFFLDWLSRNQEEIEAGAAGNLKELAALCALWARATLIIKTAVEKGYQS
jgi:hypothetical protein